MPSEQPVPISQGESPIKSESGVNEERKARLMRDMASLRLQAEVSQLENSLKNEEFSLPPYLVADASVLCANLNFIQRFVQSQRFIIVIPLVGQCSEGCFRSKENLFVSLRCSDR